MQNSIMQSNNALNTQLFDNQISHGWLSSEKAAFYLGVSPNALRIMVHRNKVRAHKLGRRLKFRLSDLRASISTNGG